jgi:hypothetical protein
MNTRLFTQRRAARDRNMAVRVERTNRARRFFEQLFDFCQSFTYVELDREYINTARKYWPRLSEDTEAYIERTPSLSPLSIRLLRDNAEFKGPLYPLLREYLWGQVCGVPMRQPFTYLDELLDAIAQLQWREGITSICMNLGDGDIENQAELTSTQHKYRQWWDAGVHARFYACVREFRDHCLGFIDTLDHLEGDPRENAAPLLLRRDAFLAGRERPRERRWALAALGIGRADKAPPYISDVDVDTDTDVSDASDA